MTHENLCNQVESFGWHVIEVDGNNIAELHKAFEKAKTIKEKPTCLIAHTIKGFGGGDIMENKASWHHHVPNQEEYEAIVASLDSRKEAIIHE
jgi:transketolase